MPCHPVVACFLCARHRPCHAIRLLWFPPCRQFAATPCCCMFPLCSDPLLPSPIAHRRHSFPLCSNLLLLRPSPSPVSSVHVVVAGNLCACRRDLLHAVSDSPVIFVHSPSPVKAMPRLSSSPHHSRFLCACQNLPLSESP